MDYLIHRVVFFVHICFQTYKKYENLYTTYIAESVYLQYFRYSIVFKYKFISFITIKYKQHINNYKN